MADGKKDPSLELGIFGRGQGRGFGPAELIAGMLSLLWLLGAVVFFGVFGMAQDIGPAGILLAVIAVVLPILVFWLAASAARAARVMRDQGSRLESAMAGMRNALIEAQHSQSLGVHAVSFEKKLEEIVQAQRQTESAIATFASTRSQAARRLAPPPEETARLVGPVDSEGQASLALGTPAEALAAPIDVDDLVRAVNFPENADDAEGFDALRRALADRKVAHLIQAAQDVLTLLAQDGIYMDDLRPDRARPEIWRSFAQGMRGRPVAALGGIRDRSSLALTAGRMRQDAVFRDAAHHFLRRFDDVISALEPILSDADLARIGDTRTAHAFMLLGRVTGTFD